jgi:diketogulonate reductase-like aldo/keto reductase
VGQAVDESPVPRSEIYITTKIMHGNWQPADPDILGTLRQAVYKVQPAASAPNSDVKPYVDLFLIHAPTMGQAKREEIWAALAQLQKEGLTKDIGVSNLLVLDKGPELNISGVKHLQMLPGPKPVINQIQIHPWLQQQEIVDYCVANDIVIEAYSPLARGDPSKINDPIVMRLAKSYSKDPGAILVRWSLQKGCVNHPVCP